MHHTKWHDMMLTDSMGFLALNLACNQPNAIFYDSLTILVRHSQAQKYV